MPKKSNFLTLQSVLLASVFVHLQTPHFHRPLVATPRRELDATTTTATDACAGIEAAAARWAGAMPSPLVEEPGPVSWDSVPGTPDRRLRPRRPARAVRRRSGGGLARSLAGRNDHGAPGIGVHAGPGLHVT